MIEDLERKVLYKTSNGVEYRPVLRDEKSNYNFTYYYVQYSYHNELGKWIIETNKLLYNGECSIVAYCDSKEDAECKASLINSCINNLISNGIYPKH